MSVEKKNGFRKTAKPNAKVHKKWEVERAADGEKESEKGSKRKRQ